MRYSIFTTLVLTFILPFQSLSKHATVEIRLAQVDWNPKTKELQFDLELRAVDKPFYLAFSDVVLAIPKSALELAELSYSKVAGSTQLLNLGREVLSFPNIRTKIRAGQDTIYFVVQIMPNQFSDLTDFFEQSAYIDKISGESRIGRFSLIGISQVPVVLKPHFAAKGPSSLILAFDPNDELRAVELTEKWQGTRPKEDELKYFEFTMDSGAYHFSWKWHSSKQAWKLWATTDQKNWILVKEGTGDKGLNLSRAVAAGATGLDYTGFRLSHFGENGVERAVSRYIAK